MADIKKHVGSIVNTGTRVAVVFREVPNDTSYCLVVETDRLPDGYHDDLINVINSKEAQDTVNLYDVLNRRTFHDGLNCLSALHHKGYLRKVEVSAVNMLPRPNQPVPLALINAQINGTVADYKKAQEPKVEPVVLSPVDRAKALLASAKEMEDKAEAMREEAYTLVPELRPQGRGRPKLDPLAKQEVAEERKELRKAKASETKAKAKEKALDEAVAQKIARDASKTVTGQPM